MHDINQHYARVCTSNVFRYYNLRELSELVNREIEVYDATIYKKY